MKLIVLLSVAAAVAVVASQGAEIGRRIDRPQPAIHRGLRMKLPPAVQRALLRADPGNANEYMDMVLELLRQQIVANGLDRVELPDGDLSFSMPFWPFGTVSGGVYLTQGFMVGMETIRRVGDATLSNDGAVVIFESDMGINNAGLGYDLAIKFLDIGPSGSLAGTITYANFYFRARIDVLAATVDIETLNIKDIGHISTDITGLGIFNWLAELIADVAINLVKGIIKELIEGPIRNLMNSIIQDLLNNGLSPPAQLIAAAILL